jgi:hypothetical protein
LNEKGHFKSRAVAKYAQLNSTLSFVEISQIDMDIHHSLLVGDKASTLAHFSEFLIYDLVKNKEYEKDFPKIMWLNTKNEFFKPPEYGKCL